jgi:hypothetical protein
MSTISGRILQTSATMASPGRSFPSAAVTLDRGRKTWTWIVGSCPFCGRGHVHGGGPLAESPFRHLGARVRHCGNGDGINSYILCAAPESQDVYRSYRAREAAESYSERSRAAKRRTVA